MIKKHAQSNYANNSIYYRAYIISNTDRCIRSLRILLLWRAKEISPYLMRLDDLLKKIAMAQNTLEETKAELRAKTNGSRPGRQADRGRESSRGVVAQ